MRVRMAGVLIRKAEKISAKNGNKFAFLTLSDSSGVFEVMLFSETLMRCRSFLEPGEALLLMVDAELRDDQLRMTVQDVKPLDQALDSQIREVTVEIAAAAQIKTADTTIKEHLRNTYRVGKRHNNYFALNFTAPFRLTQ